MLAKELMSTPPTTIREDATLAEAAVVLLEKRVSCLPIVNEADELVGILTSTDFSPREVSVPYADVKAVQLFRKWLGPGGIEAAYHESKTIPLRDVMNTEPIVAHAENTIEEVAHLMISNDVNHIPVVQGKRVLGIITRHDFLRLAARG